MRIISSFRDYYDCGQQYGFDPKIIYKRETQELEANHNQCLTGVDFNRKRKALPWLRADFHVERFLLGFAGKIYLGFSFNDTYYWDEQKLADRLLKEGAHCYDWRRLKKGQDEKKIICKTLGNLSTFYSPISYKKNCLSLFEKAPIFLTKYVTRNNIVVLNPPLAPLHFQSVLSPTQAYQELSMWCGSHMFEVKEVPVPPDKDMVSIKGFDRFSFRKDKHGN